MASIVQESPMSEQDIRNLLSGMIEQVNSLLEAFERRSLLEQQKTREQLGAIRDGLRDDMDARFDVAFSEIDEIKAARTSLDVAVTLLRTMLERLERLAPSLEQPAQTVEDNARQIRAVRREMRLGAGALAAGLTFTLALLILHIIQMMQVTVLAGG